MAIDPERVQAIFLAALQLSDTTGRTELLSRECGDDIELRLRVVALLDAHAASSGFGADSPTFSLAATSASVPLNNVGMMIAGRYKLIQAIGEGGMGSVWLAEQKEPVKRKVALKLIKAGMDSAQVLARFEAERQALAMMDHPNICKVLDGGIAANGRPFFVMEFVKGIAITEYCDSMCLGISERLQLFAQVCQAVQHAHQKGIIHRDLKPSNILVAMYDDKPVPKVIDFGLVKAINQSLTDRTLYTGVDVLLGTPLYMSPEQAQINNLDVDTRSDIYSLGVLLYELLTGSTPLEQRKLKQAAWDEIRRMIREEDPQLPSARLSSSEALPKLSIGRKSDPVRLPKLIRGELDWIVMKALEKDRSRRYETANGFSADILRYLAGDPIIAAPPSARYRIEKFARKNRWSLALASAIALVLCFSVIGLGISNALIQKAQSQTQAALDEKGRALEEKGTALDERNAALIDAKSSAQTAQERQKEAEAARDAIRLSLSDVFAAQGLMEGERQQHATAALWFANAAKLANKDPQREQANLIRAKNWARAAKMHPITAFPLAGGQVRSFTFHPKKPYLLAATDKQEVVLWDVEHDQSISMPGGQRPLGAAVWSPDGDKLALADPRQKISIFEFPSGKLISELSVNGEIRVLAYSRDGRYLGIGGEVVRVWDIETREFVTPELAHPARVEVLSFSANGDRIVTGARDMRARVFSVPSNENESPLFPPIDHVWNIDENHIYGCGINTPIFVDDDKGLLVSSSNAANVRSGATWLTVTEPLVITRVDSSSGKPIQRYRSNDGNASSNFAINPTGDQILVGGSRRSLILSLKDASTVGPALAHVNYLASAAFSPDGSKVIAGCLDRTLRTWSVPNGKLLLSTDVHSDVTAVAFSSDGRMHAAAFGDAVVVWESESPDINTMDIGSIDTNTLSAFSPDGRVFVQTGAVRQGCSMSTTAVFSIENGRQISRNLQSDGILVGAEFTADGRRVVLLSSTHQRRLEREGASQQSTSGGTVSVWDWENGMLSVGPVSLPSEPRDISVAPDRSTFAVICDSGQIRLVDLESGVIRSEFQSGNFYNPASNIFRNLRGHHVRFSPSGDQLLAWEKNPEIRIWNVTNNQSESSLSCSGATPHKLEFSPDGKLLAVASGKTADIWDFASRKLLATLPEHPDDCFSIAFNFDSSLAVTASRDGMVRVWDWRVGRLACPPMKHKDEVIDVGFAIDEKCVISAGIDGIGLWDTRSGKPLAPMHGRERSAYWHLAFTKDRRLAAVSGNTSTIPLFDFTEICSVESLDSEFFCRLIELLSHQRIHESGDIENISVGDWLVQWRDLHREHPGYMKTLSTLAEQRKWHQYEARICMASQNVQAAKRHLDWLIAESPLDLDSLRERAEINLILGNWTGVLQDATRVIDEHKWRADDFLNRGTAYLKLEDYVSAEKDFVFALKVNPGLPVVFLGRALSMQGKIEKAIDIYNDAIRLNPNDIGSQNALAWLLATSTNKELLNAEEAARLARKCVEILPAEGNFWRTLGVSLYRCGKWQEAIDSLKKSDGLMTTNSPSTAIFLSMAYWKLGQTKEAHVWYEKSFERMKSESSLNEELLRFRAEAEELMGT